MSPPTLLNGRAESQATVARKLIAMGMALEVVLEATGLTPEALQELLGQS